MYRIYVSLASGILCALRLPRLHSSTDLSRRIERVISPAGQGYVYLILCLGYSVRAYVATGCAWRT